MTVYELIRVLTDYDPNLEVVVEVDGVPADPFPSRAGKILYL